MDAQTPDTLLAADLGPNLIVLTADVVSAYVSNNSVAKADLPGLIASVHGAIAGLDAPKVAAEVEVDRPSAAKIKASITPDYLVSFEDGRRYKIIRRHLNGRGLTPEQYRQKWSLPSDYPTVAPAYAAQRSELARSMGLGRKRKGDEAGVAPAETPPEPTPAEPAKKPRARKSAVAEAA